MCIACYNKNCKSKQKCTLSQASRVATKTITPASSCQAASSSSSSVPPSPHPSVLPAEYLRYKSFIASGQSHNVQVQTRSDTVSVDIPVIYNHPPPSPTSLSQWTTADWNNQQRFTIGNPTDKGYIYNSALALPGAANKIFGPHYVAHNDGIEFEANQSGAGPGVPGPFDYALPYSSWGGDEVLVGKQNYGQILGHFGHTHIMAIQAKIEILRRDPNATASVQDKLLKHLLNGSTQIFAWYAQLVDDSGKFVDLSQEHPLVAQLKGMMGMMIFGLNTPNNNGHVDIHQLALGMQSFVDQYAVGPGHAAVLSAELSRLQTFLGDVLKLGTPHAKPLLSWKQLMDMHQEGSEKTYSSYRYVYQTNPSVPNYQTKKAEANAYIQHHQDMGYQMAAFFGAFYSLTNFLDKLYIPHIPGDEYAIPIAIVDTNIDWILATQKRYWYEHTIMFSDYNKAAALNDEDTMYKISVWFLESCAFIASSVGEIFYRFDRLVRGRKIYQVLAQFPTE